MYHARKPNITQVPIIVNMQKIGKIHICEQYLNNIQLFFEVTV